MRLGNHERRSSGGDSTMSAQLFLSPWTTPTVSPNEWRGASREASFFPNAPVDHAHARVSGGPYVNALAAGSANEAPVSGGVVDAHIEDIVVTDSYVRATIRDNTNKEMRIVEYQLSNDSRADITMTVRDFAGKEKSKQRWAFVVEDNALVVEQNGKPLARFPGFNKEKLRPRPPKQTAKSRNGGDETDASFKLMHHIPGTYVFDGRHFVYAGYNSGLGTYVPYTHLYRYLYSQTQNPRLNGYVDGYHYRNFQIGSRDAATLIGLSGAVAGAIIGGIVAGVAGAILTGVISGAVSAILPSQVGAAVLDEEGAIWLHYDINPELVNLGSKWAACWHYHFDRLWVGPYSRSNWYFPVPGGC